MKKRHVSHAGERHGGWFVLAQQNWILPRRQHPTAFLMLSQVQKKVLTLIELSFHNTGVGYTKQYNINWQEYFKLEFDYVLRLHAS